MATTCAFVVRAGEGQDDVRWERVTDPPFVISHGTDDFVALKAGQRAYVNGFPVIGLHPLTPGDLVRVVEPGTRGEVASFRFAGRTVGGFEPGESRRCAFTGLPISGRAVRCPACSRLLSEEAVDQIKKCPCGQALGGNDGERELPPEDLL